MDTPNYLYTSRELIKLILSGGILYNEIELFFNEIARRFKQPSATDLRQRTSE
jgi:hypothetical protein